MAKNGPTPKRKNLQNRAAINAIMNEPLPTVPDLEWDPNNPQMVNGCSGHSTDHTAECDGKCKMKEVDEWDIRIENENRAWFRMGAQPDAELLRREVQIQTIIKIILEKLDMTEADFNAIFKPLMFDLLHTTRIANEEMIKSARLRSKIHLPGGPLQ